MKKFDREYCLRSFERLLAVDSTTGQYEEIQTLIASMLDELGVPYELTHKGGVIAALPPWRSPPCCTGRSGRRCAILSANKLTE